MGIMKKKMEMMKVVSKKKKIKMRMKLKNNI